MKQDYVYWDTAPYGTTANTEHVLFQVSQGADSTHTESFTNMIGAGSFPTSISFTVKNIQVFPDEDITQANLQKVYKDAFIEIKLDDKSVFKSPLHLVASGNNYSGHYSQGTAADANNSGIGGKVFELGIPLIIPGGVPLKVRVFQGTALGAATDVRVCLVGEVESK